MTPKVLEDTGIVKRLDRHEINRRSKVRGAFAVCDKDKPGKAGDFCIDCHGVNCILGDPWSKENEEQGDVSRGTGGHASCLRTWVCGITKEERNDDGNLYSSLIVTSCPGSEVGKNINFLDGAQAMVRHHSEHG